MQRDYPSKTAEKLRWISLKKQALWILFLIGCLLSGPYAFVAAAADAPDQLVRDFVTRFYQECLNREPDPAGLDTWVNSLVDGTNAGADVAYGFVFSNEFLGRNTDNTTYLEILYRAFFDRGPDQTGLQNWLAALETGKSRETVFDGFVHSQEFEHLCTLFGIKPYSSDTRDDDPVVAFVTRFYQECLHRNPDTAGLNGWVDSLKSGTNTGADVAYGFVFSPEFLNMNTSNQAYLTVLYHAFFDRDPDQGGLQNWLADLNAGKSREAVLNGFVYSQEFVKLCSKFGITPYDGYDGDPADNPTAGSHAGRFSVYEGTQTCLTCHEAQALEVHNSVHYQWLGDASETVGLNSLEAGKLGGINDFCIYPDINWIGKLTNINGQPKDGGCAKCHVGLGAKPTGDTTRAQLENIDCLTCHSDSYVRTVEKVDEQFRFVPDTAKMNVSILQAAVDIQKPSNQACLNCHAYSGGGDNFKRGDIEAFHADPTKQFDVHLSSKSKGGAGLKCTDCHTVSDHRFAGRGTDLRPRESSEEVSCARCHGTKPHDEWNINKHTARVNCTVCHIPYFAKSAATDMLRDWSKPGDLVESKGLYEPSHEKQMNVVPEYKFFNGKSVFYQFGEPVTLGDNGKVVMSGPMGDINDPTAKIHAFKYHRAKQPIDPVSRKLLPIKIGKFFESGTITTAVELGVAAVGWPDNGFEFAETERYLGLFHEVVPEDDALACASCHSGGTRLDFAALGYTPKQTNNGKPLCTSCHGQEDEDDEWSDYFKGLHAKHVDDKNLDCSNCHTFSSAN